MIATCKEELVANRCYPKQKMEILASYKIDLPTIPHLYKAIIPFCKKLEENSNIEEFYKNYYGKILKDSQIHLPNLNHQLGTLLLKKVGEKVVAHLMKPSLETTEESQSIDEIEIDVIQYLSGYIVHKFKRKMSKKEHLCALLDSFVTDDKDDQKLIKTLDRGGLLATKKEIQKIFTIVEERFRKENILEKRKVEAKSISSELLGNANIISLFSSIVDTSGVTIDAEIAHSLLEKMMQLYIRVRAFSFAQETISKMNMSKNKGLRKSIKQKTTQ